MKKYLLLLLPLTAMIAVSCGKEESQDAVDKRVKEIWGETAGEKRELLWSFAYDNEGRVAEAINRRSNDIMRYDYSDNMVVETHICSNSFDGDIESYKKNYYLDNDGFLVKERYQDESENEYPYYVYENGYLSKEIGTFVDYVEFEQISGEYIQEYIWDKGNLYGGRKIYTLPNGDVLREDTSEVLVEYSNILNKTSINIGHYLSNITFYPPSDGLCFMKFKGTYCTNMSSSLNHKDGQFSYKWDYKVDPDGYPTEIHGSGYYYDIDDDNYIRVDESETYYIIYE